LFNTFKFIKNNRALQFIALFFIIQNILSAEILTNVNDKYFWVNRESLLDSTKIDSVVLFAEENNLNKIFFQIRGRGDALYDSQIVPKYEKIDSLFDPLSYIINTTENKNIEIHAWFNTYILWSSPSMPKDSLHFYYLCPECFATDFNGKSDKSINLGQNQSANWEGVFLSPLNRKVNNHILMVIDELINSYDIDGLHLDYIRFQDMFYGYNNEGLDDFVKKYNFNPKDIDRGIISSRFGYSDFEVDSLTTLWDNYKSSSITNLVKDIKSKIVQSQDSIILSVAVKPNIIESKYRWYQDWINWLELGYVDYAVVMNYESDINKFNFNNRLINNRLNEEKRNRIVMGISTFNQSAINASDKIILSRLSGYKNYSIFNYNNYNHMIGWYNPIINVLNFNIE